MQVNGLRISVVTHAVSTATIGCTTCVNQTLLAESRKPAGTTSRREMAKIEEQPVSESEMISQLEALLAKIQKAPGSRISLSQEEISLLVSSLSKVDNVTIRSKGFIALAAFAQGIRSSIHSTKTVPGEVDPGAKEVAQTFSRILSNLSTSTEEHDILSAAVFLSSLFQVDTPAASVLTVENGDGILDTIMDAIDMPTYTNPKLHLAVAHLLALAAGDKKTRSAFPPQTKAWLEEQSSQIKDLSLKAAAAVALVKLSRGSAQDASEITSTGIAGDSASSAAADSQLADLMRTLVLTSSSKESEEKSSTLPLSSVADAIEGLAYLSTDSSVKESLASDPAFLTKLFGLIPRRKRGSSIVGGTPMVDVNPTVLYGTMVIITNLVSYPPRMNEEQAQIAKLRKMAKGPGSSSNVEADPREDDAHVKARGVKLIAAGVLDVLSAAVTLTDSRAVRASIGKAYLSLVTNQDIRGKVLQTGGAKALLSLVNKIMAEASESIKSKGQAPSKVNTELILPLDAGDFECIQALAKLTITSPPLAVFGPDPTTPFSAIPAFVASVTHPNSSLLQRFESLMALTNVSSASPQAAERVASAPGLMNKVELLMLEDHVLVRRASVELICNLIVGSDSVFQRYSGSGPEKSMGALAKSKLQILLALSDVADLPTRSAASGALATLTAEKSACLALLELQHERNRVFRVLTTLIDPSVVPKITEAQEDEEEVEEVQEDAGLVHRAVVCVSNLLFAVEDGQKSEVAKQAQEVGLPTALIGVIKKGGNPAVLQPAMEAVKWILKASQK